MLSIATSTPLTEASRYIQWALYIHPCYKHTSLAWTELVINTLTQYVKQWTHSMDSQTSRWLWTHPQPAIVISKNNSCFLTPHWTRNWWGGLPFSGKTDRNGPRPPAKKCEIILLPFTHIFFYCCTKSPSFRPLNIFLPNMLRSHAKISLLFMLDYTR